MDDEPALAKSSGITFREHTDDVRVEAACLIARLGYRNKFERLTGRNLREEVLQAAEAHDRGKKDKRWQDHASDGNLREVGFRHELESLRRSDGLDSAQKTAVAAHHGKLSVRHEHRWNGSDIYDYSDLWREFVERSVQEGRSLKELARLRYEHDTVRAILRMADQRASQIEGEGPDPLPVRPFRYQFDYKEKRPVQSLAVEHASDPVLALRAETGSGKTDGALLWARKQVRSRRARRVIFALPTRFTSTALSQDIGGSLYHSSAWRKLDGSRVADRLGMAEKFVSPRVVTTIDQILAAVAGRREVDHTRFANLAHSALVIDECDFYDDVVQANIDLLIDVCDALEIPVLVMSATLPKAHVSTYFPGEEKGQVREPGHADEEESENQEPDRPGEDTGSGQWQSSFTVTKVQEAESLPWKIREPRAIIYANTTARARDFYQSVAQYRDDVVLYHSRFTEPHKVEKEKQVRSMLGEDGTGGVAIMTQIGEMSINVSAPLQISDLCPIDRLAQRTGRLCRFFRDEGELRLLIPTKNGSFYPAPYGSLSNEYRWTPAQALRDTRSFLKEGMTLSKQDLTEATDKIYSGEQERSVEAQENQQRYSEALRSNWLVLPDTSATDDDPSDGQWAARMIPPTVDIWIAPSELQSQYDGFREWRLEHANNSCSVPHYVIEQSPEKVERVSVRVSGEKKSVTVLTDASNYNKQEGLLI